MYWYVSWQLPSEEADATAPQAERAPNFRGASAAGLLQGALPPPQRLWQPPVPAAATDPPRRQRPCNAWGDPGITAREDVGAQIMLPARGKQRQSLRRIVIP